MRDAGYAIARGVNSSRLFVRMSASVMMAITRPNPTTSMAAPTHGATTKARESAVPKKLVTDRSASPLSSNCRPTVPTVYWHCSMLIANQASMRPNSTDVTCFRKLRVRSRPTRAAAASPALCDELMRAGDNVTASALTDATSLHPEPPRNKRAAPSSSGVSTAVPTSLLYRSSAFVLRPPGAAGAPLGGVPASISLLAPPRAPPRGCASSAASSQDGASACAPAGGSAGGDVNGASGQMVRLRTASIPPMMA
mmetsp:Transcript_30314/g.97874  ORF Transcript_30314/g.97874 Transcript_30314/m.97874 type:complete len:253 (+) Transcript_30314:816-1574(+)